MSDITNESGTEGRSILARAADELRGHQDQRWVEIEDLVLSRILLATRRSRPVRAETPDADNDGRTYVSEAVLTAYLADALDDIPGSAVDEFLIATDRDNNYTGITIVVCVQFGQIIIPLADRLRQAAESVLTTLLGASSPPITVTGMHVHVDDVQSDDPKLS